ncbi:MAG: DUF2797 domain-containing protein [Methanomassiliicoccales archaeon]|nr:DUF2797 domain-containing protein [Methanomassiliicoccales archaeon]
MFETADEILRRKGLMAYSSHVLSWDWDGFQPGLTVFDLKEKCVKDNPLRFLPGDRLDLMVSPERRCVGSFADDGYQPCMLRQIVSGPHDQCPQCASSWIPRQSCVFEPECDGVHDMPCGKGGNICALQHHVYAAFYGDMIKVGMTLSSRFRERGIEQGADAIARLGTYLNRLEARRAENALSKALKATQWVRKTTFLKLQGRQVDREAYQKMLERSLSSLADVPTDPSPVEMLDQYPLLNADLSKAQFADVPGRHRGEVLGCKGKFLFYRLRDGSVQLLDMASVPSRFLMLKQGNNNKC